MSKPKIFIAGHKGMVGSALARFLKKKDVAQKKLHRFSTITHSKIYSKIFEKI